MAENEDEDPVGCPPVRDPLREFRAIAEKHNLIRPDDPLDDNLVQAFYAVVERCACVSDQLGCADEQCDAGAAIRAELGADPG